MRSYLQPYDPDLLLALAWTAPLTTHQLHRLAAPTVPLRTIQNRLTALRAHGLMQAELYYRVGPHATPRRAGRIWSLTLQGFGCLDNERHCPTSAAAVRMALLEHDLLLSELVVTIVERIRPVLSGIYLDREARLDDQRTRPICDGILLLRRSPRHVPPAGIPWLRGPPAPDEAIRGYAIEIDRHREAIGIIREKALAYQASWRDPSFYARYGKFPLPLWLVPGQHRLETIGAAWQDAWPEGRWLIATEEGLRRGQVEEWREGTRRTRALLEGWEPDAP